MYIDHIKTFLEVTSTGSFQLAAEKLYVTQSTVSARIKALEDQLNRPLFIRKRSGVELTAGGQRFHPHALTVVQAWGRAKQEVALPEALTSITNLGIQLNHWDQLATPWLLWMEQHMPESATQIIAEYSDSLMRKVRDGVLDLAVMYQPQQRPGIVIEPLMSESLIMVSSTPRTISIGQVPGYIFVDWGDAFRTEHSMAFPDAPTHRLTIGLGAVALEHILKRGGSGYFIESMVNDLIAEGLLHRVEGSPVFQRPLYLVYQEEPINPELLEAAVRGLKEVSLATS